MFFARLAAFFLFANLATNLFQDRNGDGITDYVNARIYVADQATPAELAGAANIAARLGFETLSLDLPLGFPMSVYSNADSSVAIVVGSAATRFAGGRTAGIVETTDGSRKVIAVLSAADAEAFAVTLGTEPPKRSEKPHEEKISPKDYSLAKLFSPDGLLGDSARNFLPDRTDTTIVLGPDVHSTAIVDLAARIGLETTGLRLPLVEAATEKMNLQNPVLVGLSNPYVQKLIKDGKFKPQLQAGQGRVEIVEKAFGDQRALVIAGADAAGETAALEHAAQRLPYAWEYGKDRLHLGRVENDLRRFFALRSPAGKAAAALYKARRLAKKLDGKDLESAELKLFVEGAGEPYLDYVRGQFPRLKLTAADVDVFSAQPILEKTFELPWEVAEARQKIAQKVLSKVKPGAAVDLELRVSEPPEVRRSLKSEIRRQLIQAGAGAEKTQVHVLSAHKQCYSYIEDELKPRLKKASRVRIYFRELKPLKWQTVESPIRWLQEMFPIDEVLARDLKIPVDDITFQKTESGPTYRIEAEDAQGRRLLEASCEPKFVVRPLFEQFPQYESARVTTGWLKAQVDGAVVADERIKIDPERFWDLYQSGVLGTLHDYVLNLFEGKPRAQWAPYFGSLEVELWMSEPDYNLGLQKERISTLEALHEDIYFETIHFFDVLGLQYAGERLTYPGRIIPRIHPARPGRGATVKIRLTGKAGPNPRVELVWKERGKPQERRTEDLWPIAVEPPKIVGETVGAGRNGVVSVEVLEQTDSVENRRDELIRGTREETVDRTLLSTEQAAAMIENVRELREHGIGKDWLSYEALDSLKFRFQAPARIQYVEFPRGAEFYRLRRLEASRSPKKPIVQWDAPISPEECEQIIADLAGFREVQPFYTTSSYLGRPIWAMDVMAPHDGKFWSQAKASVTKPVLFITGRQHANEISSTSHILKLVELLVTDPEYHKLPNKVNFIIHPITNPDGAALAYELQKTTPDFMLHAGYLGSLGVDVTQGQWDTDPMYPETTVRKDLWQMWLPDIVLNPHGYPSHEWVQLFAGYAAWVRWRVPEGRGWWVPRGWFMPGFNYVQDPKFPDHQKTAFAIRDRIAAAIESAMGPTNEIMYRRYEKYGAWDRKDYKVDLYKNVMIYSAVKGAKQSNTSPSFMVRHPNVTVFDGGTEAPDETAHGDWLKLVANAGLQFDLAHARFLAESKYEVKRNIETFTNATVLTLSRKRPVLPPEEKKEAEKPAATN